MNVKIIRVLNTNAVVSVDSQGMELIMTGPGIGFKKRKGENIDQSLVDKTYHLENKEESKRLQEVVKEISEEYLGIADRVVKEAKKEKLEIRDSLYVTLTDHINSAVARYREGIALKNMMKIDIRKFYPKEYQVGMHAIEWIKEQTGEDLGDDEAAFIAMHIVSAELNAQNITDVNQITELINTVLQIVRIHFKIDLNEESISYERFLTHLKFFAARVFDHMEYEDTMQEIYKVMVEQNENAFSGVKKLQNILKSNITIN
jgi:beta-glucoside operon transcriptional antiterminator